MNITIEKINNLKLAEYNPRVQLKPGMPEYDKLKNSIQKFGYIEPVIVNDRTGIVVGGHQRLAVLKDLGYTDIEVVHVDLDDIHEKALNIALNKISGEWDANKLEDILREIDINTSIDLELTGFDYSELETIYSGAIDELEESSKNRKKYDKNKQYLLNFAAEAKLPENNLRNIRVGDKWSLGRHILYCADSFNPETYNKLLDGKTPSMIFSDPPYQYKSFNNRDAIRMASKNIRKCGNKQAQLKEDGFGNFDISNIEYLFDKGIKSLYFCCNRYDLINYINLAVKYKYVYDIHVWYKYATYPYHSSSYLNDIEYIVYCRLPNATFNGDLNTAYYHHFVEGPSEDESIEYKFYSKAFISASTKKDYGDKNIKLTHPTIKPLKLIIPRVAISSNQDDIVVDMFCGSGSTLIACEKLGRQCYTVEILPKYMNETINRWEALTGEKAVYLGNDDGVNTDPLDIPEGFEYPETDDEGDSDEPEEFLEEDPEADSIDDIAETDEVAELDDVKSYFE